MGVIYTALRLSMRFIFTLGKGGLHVCESDCDGGMVYNVLLRWESGMENI